MGRYSGNASSEAPASIMSSSWGAGMQGDKRSTRHTFNYAMSRMLMSLRRMDENFARLMVEDTDEQIKPVTSEKENQPVR